MRYFVLYDPNGNCQRVASTRSDREAQEFLSAGFVEVDQQEYDRCAALVPNTTLRDIGLLVTALGVLGAIARTQRAQPGTPDRAALVKIQGRFQELVTEASQRLARGEITSDQFYQITSRYIRQAQLASRGAGVGGIQRLSARDLDFVRAKTQQQLAYLNRFRQEIDQRTADGTPFSEKQLVARSKLYAGSTGETFERAIQDALGMPALPAQPGVRTLCHTNCKCSWDIRPLAGNGNWDCYWRLAPAEHCDTCKSRQRAFNPLRIRNGIIQPYRVVGIYA